MLPETMDCRKGGKIIQRQITHWTHEHRRARRSRDKDVSLPVPELLPGEKLERVIGDSTPLIVQTGE